MMSLLHNNFMISCRRLPVIPQKFQMWTPGRQMLEQKRNFNDKPITENMQQKLRKQEEEHSKQNQARTESTL